MAEVDPERMGKAQKNLEEMNLSSDEVSKFETAFKDPEFKKMFMEYAQEISDPKNKAGEGALHSSILPPSQAIPLLHSLSSA